MKYVFFILLFPCLLMGQEATTQSNFRFHHIGATLGTGIPDEGDNLLTGGIEVAGAFSANILKLSYIGGAEVDFPGGNSVGDFREWSLLYGREFSLNDWLSFDPYAGLGIFGVRDPKEEAPDKTNMENSLGIPIEGNLRFHFLETVSFGIRGRHNFNSDKDISFFGGFLQYRF